MLHLKEELNDRVEDEISPSWIEKKKKLLTFLQYRVYSREKPSKSNPCANYPYIDSCLMAHIALKSDLKGRQAKAKRRKGLLKYEEWKCRQEGTSISYPFMSTYRLLDCE